MKSNALALVSAFALTANAYDLHTKALPKIDERAKPAGDAVTLVKDGNLNFVIVGDHMKFNHRSSVWSARQILEEAFERTVGVKPEIFDAVKDRAKWEAAPAILLLGDSAAAREFGFDASSLPDQGFLVSTFPKGLAIIGNDERVVGLPPEGKIEKRGTPMSTLFGAVDFCERILGVRYYFPGELGCLYPKTDGLTVAPVHYESAPYFNTRGNPYGFYCTDKAGVNGEKWEKFLGAPLKGPDIKQRWRLGMTMELLGKHNPDPRDVAKAHPDKLRKIFYTSPNGHFWYDAKNYFANYYDVINLGKGGFADILVEDWKRYYASNGTDDPLHIGGLSGQEWINFGVTDVYMNPEDYLADPVIQKLRLVQKSDYERGDDRTIMANVYGRFYDELGRRLKKELPGKKLFILAYYNCKYAPTRYVLPDNVDAIVCDGSLLSYVKDPAAAAKSQNLFKGWYKALGNRAPGMVYLYASGSPLGNGTTCEYLGDCVKLLGPYLGKIGIFYDGGRSYFRYWTYYAGAHQQWDPDFDPVASFDEMAERMFGPKAAPYVKRFHLKLRENLEKYEMPTLMNRATPPCPEAAIAEMEKLLSQARAALEPGSVEMQRFEVFAYDWPATFEKLRGNLKKLSDGKGIYNVERRSGSVQDWSKIPPVPGSNGLKLVWNADGLYGRADGAVHYTIRGCGPNAADIPLDYDTMVPGFNVNFGTNLSGRVYRTIELKPFGRLRLLGEGDSATFGAVKGNAIGDMSGKVKLSAAAKGDSFTIAAPKATYTPAFKLVNGRGDVPHSVQAAMAGPGDCGFFSWSRWLQLSVNGIEFGQVNFGSDNLEAWTSGEKRGYQYKLNFDGAKALLRFYMLPKSSFLFGELEFPPDTSRAVTNAALCLASIPSKLCRDKKAAYPYKREIRTAARLIEKTDPLTAEDKNYVFQDANWNGSAEDRGMGPTLAFVDWQGVESGKAVVKEDSRDVYVEFNLKPEAGKVTFGVWEDRGHRHSNDEIFNRFTTERGNF